MAVTTSWAMKIDTTETLTSRVDGAVSPSIDQRAMSAPVSGQTSVLTSTSTPAATKCSYNTLSLTAGAKTIDLTSIPTVTSATDTMTGLKVQLCKIKNNGANAMTFTFGASNGYLLLGTAWKIILPAGAEVMFNGNNGAAAIDGTHKTIDVSGTGTDSFDFAVICG
jgi:archaellin